jgi:tRNA threonylcarbamoyladenosine biosynthesis protein TsaE
MCEAELVSESAADTERLAEAIAGLLVPGDVVLIEGEVGTGKTTFVRGACRALGVTDTVSSPSFTIGQRYGGRVPVSHMDLFRLESLQAEDPALLADYLDSASIAFVEWPKEDSSLLGLAPERVPVLIALAHLGGDRRRVRIAGRAAVVERARR